MEQSLVEHVGRGEVLDLATDDEVISEAPMWSWGKARIFSAAVARDISRGRGVVVHMSPLSLNTRQTARRCLLTGQQPLSCAIV